MKTQFKVQQRFGFYAILTDPLKGYVETTKILVDNGIKLVQLRMKYRSEEEVLKVAYSMREITEGSSTKLIINDFPRITRQCGAEGVHLGQTDMAYDAVREITGSEKIIGLSTHSPEQVIAACKLRPDYIGVGPVYTTPTKENPDPVIGIDTMKAMLSLATVPAVAIGGIDFSNIRTVLEAGAQNFSMVRQFTKSDDPEKTLKEILKIYNDYYPE
jgi:thiamine-phosphate pyrophosphorylase